MKTKHGQSQLPEIALPWLVVAELATWIGASFIWPLTSVYLNKRLGISPVGNRDRPLLQLRGQYAGVNHQRPAF
jgi:hypothetical protein